MNLKINIPKNPALIVKMLIGAGFEAGFVGGCIRDSIMSEIAHDFDICTSATPDEILSVFKNFKTLTLGLKHGTITIIIDNEEIEVTTFRIDGNYTDGRRPDSVDFTKSLEDDLSRRDFTINAIFYNEYVGIIDPFLGAYDIENKLIRCVGNPTKRLQEDALRILRGIRFSSKLGFRVEEATKASMFKNMKLLNNVSKERISDEFIKMLQGKNAINVLDEFKEIIVTIIPEIKPLINFKQNNPFHIYDIWKHTLISVENAKGLILKLTMFFHDIGKPSCHTVDEQGIDHFYNHPNISTKITSEIFKRMKLTSVACIDTKDLDDVLELIKYHDTIIEPNKKSIIRTLSQLNGNIEQFKRLLLVKKADALAQSPNKLVDSLKKIDEIEIVFNEVIAKNTCTTLKDLAINGKDLIVLGFTPGVKIGKILSYLLEAVINEDLPNEKEVLLNAAKKNSTNIL